jgi:hypothetical protein
MFPPNAMNSCLEPLNHQLLQQLPSSCPLPGEREGVRGNGAFELLLACLPTTVHGEEDLRFGPFRDGFQRCFFPVHIPNS